LAAAGLAWPAGPNLGAAAATSPYRRLLILVELKGGNDGLNTVVPYTDPNYYALRPRIAIRRDEVLPIWIGHRPASRAAAAAAAVAGGRTGDGAGLGYPNPNLSHFRSIEIWDTASRSDEYLQQGWLARSFRSRPPPAAFAADAVVVGSQDMGPLVGGGRVVALVQSRAVRPPWRAWRRRAAPGAAARWRTSSASSPTSGRGGEIQLQRAGVATSQRVSARRFRRAVRTACQVLGSGAEVAVLRLSLSGFDTHQNQPGTMPTCSGSWPRAWRPCARRWSNSNSGSARWC
jgi:uncharacterized protein (DUF1501 family)